MEIECETNGNVSERIIIGQNTILNKNKDELLVIGKVEVNRTKCRNAKIISVRRKLEYPITFRQVSKFRYDPILRRIYYNFYGLTPQRLVRGRSIKMLVFIINNGIKTQKEVQCTLNSDVELKTIDYKGDLAGAGVFKNADVIVIDSQYTVEEVYRKENWGHSSFCYAIDFAVYWNIKKGRVKKS